MIDEIQLAALIIFLGTYALISVGRAGRSRLQMPSTALAGGVIMILSGVESPSFALASINWNTVLLLLGMMLVVSGLEASGFFAWISRMLVARARTPFAFLILSSCMTALLSALILNDAVVLMFTPVIIHATRKMGISPVAPLVMEAISANIGSAATEVGNPQNAYIASVSGISFHTFSLYIIPPAVFSLLISLLIAYFFVSREKVRQNTEESDFRPGPALYFMLGLIVAVFAGFYTASLTHIPIAFIALGAGAASFFAVPFLTETTQQELIARVDWGIIIFFLGLFILIGGLQSSGLLTHIIDVLTLGNKGSIATSGGLTVVTAVLSNLVSNVPAVLLLSPFVKLQAARTLWLTLAASSTFAGNATIIGAAANVIVARSAAKDGVDIRLSQFMKIGMPVTIVSLLLTVLLI
ncbi:MAG: SLC13 family permease [Methanomassiliicoccales archaeon]